MGGIELKVATLKLTPQLFIEFCKASQHGQGLTCRFVVEANPLPDDAEVIGVYGSGWGRPVPDLMLYIQSESFAEVLEGADPPELPLVVYRAVYDKAPIHMRTPWVITEDK